MLSEGLGARQALRLAPPISINPGLITSCLDLEQKGDALFERAWCHGLGTVSARERPTVNRVTGQVAESIAETLLDQAGFTVFWHITTDGIHGVDLLFLSETERVIALEVKGTLRRGTTPRLTPSKLRQMSREWLNALGNPGMSEWQLQAEDLYAGVMVVDLAAAEARLAASHDFTTYAPVAELSVLDAFLQH